MLKYILLSHILTVALFAAQPIAQFGRAGMGGVIGNPRSSILVGSEIFVEVSLMHERPSELDSILSLPKRSRLLFSLAKKISRIEPQYRSHLAILRCILSCRAR
ncbi:MAG: hypothetical protein IPK53_01460 [bacterium]|nr:hypothetical protein [bacterium]